MPAHEIVVGTEPGVSEARVEFDTPGWTITVQLYNPSSMDVGFKALTNSPRRWSVKPNGGVVRPHGRLDVVLTAMGGHQKQLMEDRHLYHQHLSPLCSHSRTA